ncbi:MAG: Exonuclease SbcC [Ktedonobacterales bacterium]|nr:MAG: Exonuclease SbcC [Ktedonobacterales bacterium]
MRITKIQLENIKSYRHVSIPLQSGTIAIRGHNGAGKSTLVEAIGFALFDALPYDHAQFVREGERAGTVTISFLSALDEREYQVVRRCGANPQWYVFDPDLRSRSAEQKADVMDFLRKHLRLESEITLKELFFDALGVPQGTFTADFLLTPTNRKKKFDALLQVEEYRKAADNLADARTYLRDEQHAAEKRIGNLERETNQLDGWRTELAQQQRRERELAAELDHRQQREKEIVARRTELTAQREAVEHLKSAAQLAAEKADIAGERQRDATQRHEEAHEAAAACAEAQPGHVAHMAAQTQVASAQERARERDRIAQQRSDTAQRLEGESRDLDHLRARLAEARRAEQRIVELFPAVTRQGEAERAGEEARQQVRQLEETRRGIEKADRERERVAADIAANEREIATLEQSRPIAALLEARRERVTMLQAIRAQTSERKSRLAQVIAEQAKLTPAREKAAADVAKAAENLRKTHELQAEAEQVPALEAEWSRLQAEVHKLEVQRDQHRASREQTGSGTCPFLGEACLNIQQRGENSLVTFFDRRITEDERALAPVRAQLEASAKQLDKARNKRRYYDQLPQREEYHRQCSEQLDDLDDRLKRLADERAEFEQWIASSPNASDLAAAQQEFKQSDDADKQLREIGPLQAEISRLRERATTIAGELAAYHEQARALDGAPAAHSAIQQELAALGDPRNESTGLEPTARLRPQMEANVVGAEQRVDKRRQELTTLETALAPFAGLDDELRSLQDEIARTRDDHTRYLRYEQAAAQLAARAAHLAQMAAEAQSARAAADAATAAYEHGCASFDADELARVTAEASQISMDRERITSDLRYSQKLSADLAGQISRAEAMLDELDVARRDLESLKDLEKMLQQFRETIKEAGPNVTKARLRQISAVANRIFGEIMGDRSAELAWTNDYEVILRRDGKERTFAQLSGGEQMSAALAVRLALLRHLTRLDIAFFDEPTQNMDGERRGNLAEQIRRVRGFDQLFVISHDDTFEQGLDSVVCLEKRNGETHVVEDALVLA